MTEIESSLVDTSLLTDRTTLGVDDWLVVVNVAFAIVVVMAMRIPSWLLVTAVAHGGLVVVTRLSPNIMEVYTKYLAQAHRYCAGYSPYQKLGLRPAGFGKEDAF